MALVVAARGIGEGWPAKEIPSPVIVTLTSLMVAPSATVWTSLPGAAAPAARRVTDRLRTDAIFRVPPPISIPRLIAVAVATPPPTPSCVTDDVASVPLTTAALAAGTTFEVAAD